MKKSEALKGISNILATGEYKQPKSEISAAKDLNNLLTKYYSKDTIKKVYSQMETYDITHTQMLLYVRATRKYNERQASAYNAVMKNVIEPEWKKTVERQTEQWRNKIFDDDGKLSEYGKDVYSQFKKDRISDLIPTNKKSILLSKTQLEQVGFLESLYVRMNMGTKQYIDKRTEQYFTNYESAIRKKKSNPDKWINEWNRLNKEQKIIFARESLGHIRYVYQSKDDSLSFQEFKDAIDSILNENQ